MRDIKASDTVDAHKDHPPIKEEEDRKLDNAKTDMKRLNDKCPKEMPDQRENSP